jgi:predicted house-cleaning noncanonical NTP pyrophosphatase (MazG superfamily)
MEPEYMENKTPKLYNRYKEIIKSKRIKMLSDMVEIVSS